MKQLLICGCDNRELEKYVQRYQSTAEDSNDAAIPVNNFKSLLRLRQACCHPQVRLFVMRVLAELRDLFQCELMLWMVNRLVALAYAV